jgi:GGDEF domain-containing protein
MNAQEVLVWGLSLGAIAALLLARLADLAVRPSLWQAQAVAYHATVLLLVLLLSGLARQLWPAIPPRSMQAAQVLAGPVCIGLSNFWLRGWLSAAQRDRLMSWVLRLAAALLPLAGLACLGLPAPRQLPAAAALSLFGGALTVWLAVRAWSLGDRLAPLMAVGCLLTLPAIAGLYALAMNPRGMGLALHAAFAVCAALSNALTGLALWRRDRHLWRTRPQDTRTSRFDPVTRLHGGTGLVQKMIKAQRRRRRTRRDGALLAVVVFDVHRIAAQAGTAGVNEMFIGLAGRIQRQVGVVNPVGRYYERCFVTLVEAIHSPRRLRTLGLKVASSLRRPMEVLAATGERIEIRPDIGVGVVHLPAGSTPVEDMLYDAQRMAEAARAMPSRAAIYDPAAGGAVAVEHADLRPRRARHSRMVAQ